MKWDGSGEGAAYAARNIPGKLPNWMQKSAKNTALCTKIKIFG